MSNSSVTHNWETGVLPVLTLSPAVTTPLLGSVLFGFFEHPPLVPYIYGPAHNGKHALASQAAELWSNGVIVVDDGDPRELADAVRRAYNGMARITSATGPAEKTPAVIAVGENSPTDAAIAARTLPLHLEQPIPLSAMAQTLRTPAALARRDFGAAFQTWLAEQDHDELYDRYLDTWTDNDTEDPRVHAGRTAAAYGLALLGTYLDAEGVDHDPSVLQLPDPHTYHPTRPIGPVKYLSTDLITALEEGSVQLLNSTFVPQQDAPLIGKLAGDRVLLLPGPILRHVLHPISATITGLGYELERQGYLRRRDANTDVRTIVTKIEGKAQRAWDVDTDLFGGSDALGGAYDLEYFTRTNTITPEEASLLNQLLLDGHNILITGRTNSGKTLLLRALANTLRKTSSESHRVFYDDLLETGPSLVTFLRTSISENPFIATVTARSPADGVARYKSQIPADGSNHDFTVIHIDRDGTKWKLDIDWKDDQ